MPNHSHNCSDYPDDHEEISTRTADGVWTFSNDKIDKDLGRLIVKIVAKSQGSQGSIYTAEIDFSKYTNSNGIKKPVFSLYNLGLQSWKQDIELMDITYLKPGSGEEEIIDPPESKVEFAKGFPASCEWTTDPKIFEASGKVVHRIPAGKTSNNPSHPDGGKRPRSVEVMGPIEENVWFLHSKVHTRFRLELKVSLRKTVGPPSMRRGSLRPLGNESSHGNVPPGMPPGSSDDSGDD